MLISVYVCTHNMNPAVSLSLWLALSPFFFMITVWFPIIFPQTVQVIVQARLGEKICTRSSSSPTGADWVN